MPLLLLIILSACSRQLGYPEAPRSGQDISVDISALQHGIPHYFSRDLKGIKINFFVVKKTDSSVISFLDACTKCFAQKKVSVMTAAQLSAGRVMRGIP